MPEVNGTHLSFDETEKFGARLAAFCIEHANEGSLQFVASFAYAFQLKYRPYLVSVTPSADAVFKNVSELSIQLAGELQQILIDHSLSFIESFAKAKYVFDQLFFLCTEKGVLNYNYRKEGLLSSAELQKELGVSRATVSRYVKLGLETAEGMSHTRYPVHVVYYWQDSGWATKVQALEEQYLARDQSG